MKTRIFWQHAAGDTNRNYVDICLKWDVTINGPGDAGHWPDCITQLEADEWSSNRIADLRGFVEEMQDGDVVVLKIGTSNVYGIGVIQGKYAYNEHFSDVDGWDLQHVRRVKWLWKYWDSDKPKSFPAFTLKRGTTKKLTSNAVLAWIETLNLNFDTTEELAPLPKKVEKPIGFDAVSEFLFGKGVSDAAIENLNNEINSLIRIANWYQRQKGKPTDENKVSEHETIAYLAIPLLRALGWTPQKMAIEWRRIDIALFSQLPRADDNLSIVVEAKRIGQSCLSAAPQARAYAEGKPNCRRLIVTDGLRYGVYLKNENGFILHAYFNLAKLRNSYPIYNECAGVEEALKTMAPEWVSN